MEALDSHMKACRGSCTSLGEKIRLQAIHPNTQPASPDESELEVERRRGPVPGFTVTSRVGPARLRPTDDADVALQGDAEPAVTSDGED